MFLDFNIKASMSKACHGLPCRFGPPKLGWNMDIAKVIFGGCMMFYANAMFWLQAQSNDTEDYCKRVKHVYCATPV